MIIGGSLLLHGEKWAATVDDRSTLRTIRDQLSAAVAEHRQIAETIERDFRTEFDEMFADDIRRCEAVIQTCKDRLRNDYNEG